MSKKRPCSLCGKLTELSELFKRAGRACDDCEEKHNIRIRTLRMAAELKSGMHETEEPVI